MLSGDFSFFENVERRNSERDLNDVVSRYTDGDILKGAQLALEQRDLECLHLLREKAIEKPKTASLANRIDEYILQVRGKK